MLCFIEEPIISMRSPSRPPCSVALAPTTEVTRIPSRSNSASARSTLPGVASSGRRAPSTMPRGWRAPGARHVQVPSSRLLVSSISILRPMPSDNATNVGGRYFLRGLCEAPRPSVSTSMPAAYPARRGTEFSSSTDPERSLRALRVAVLGGLSPGRVRQGPRCPLSWTVAGST